MPVIWRTDAKKTGSDLGVRQVFISWYVGHKVGTLAADPYSSGGGKGAVHDGLVTHWWRDAPQ